MIERLPLKNKKIFVTGSTSGIGRAICMKCAEEGATVIHCGRRLERVNETSETISKQFGLEAIGFELDVRMRDEVIENVKWMMETHGPIDVLVNNAGLSRGLDKFQDASYEDWDEMLDTNVKGLLNVTREVVPYMIKA